MKTTTARKMLDINRLRQNNESFLLGFLYFTTSQKPPFPNSWLGFDISESKYCFMVVNNYTDIEKPFNMIYYPDNYNRILITPDTEWLYKIYKEVNYGSQKDNRKEYLTKIANKIQPILMDIINKELVNLKELNNNETNRLSKSIDDASSRTKSLF